MPVTRYAYTVPGWGVGELWLDSGVVLEHEAPKPPTAPKGTPASPESTLTGKGSRGGDAFVTELLQRIHRYFEGERVGFDDVRLELEWCSPFQRAVAEALRRVGWGEVVTYGELAALAGHPNAQRAAGTFCAQNRFWLFLPCHRVVAVGGIGSYGLSGTEYKRRLLALEGNGAF